MGEIQANRRLRVKAIRAYFVRSRDKARQALGRPLTESELDAVLADARNAWPEIRRQLEKE